MKKMISLFLCLVMVSCVALPAFAVGPESVEPQNSVYWYINANNVNFRSGPNGGYLGLVHFGDRFNNLGLEGPAGGYYWRKCAMTTGQNAGKTGYVADPYCTQYIGIE